MKTFRTSFALTLAALCYCAVSPARAAQHVSKQQWRRVKVYEMPDLQKLDPPPLGKIVGVKFNYRHTDISQPHAYWYLGSIWRVIRDPEKADFMHVNVMVAEADLPAFKAITTDPHSQRSYVVYGEVLYYRESTFSFIRLIGTKGKRDRSGNVTVSW